MSAIGSVRPITTPPPVQRIQSVARDADGDNDGTRAATVATPATPTAAPVVANGKVDLYA